jgi:hypothetical protein
MVARRLPLLFAFVAVTFAFVQAPASARHNFSILEVARQELAAGDIVEVSGFSYTEITFIRLGSTDGQVLAELEPSPDNVIKGNVQIPVGTAAGRSVLYAVQQDAEGNPSRFPGQAAVTIMGPGGPPLGLPAGFEREARPATLTESDPFSVGEFVRLVLATMGVMGVLTIAFYVLVLQQRNSARRSRS